MSASFRIQFDLYHCWNLSLSIKGRDVVKTKLIASVFFNKGSSMKTLHIIMTGMILSIVTAVVTQHAVAADAANGERLAERWCAACHVVSSAQREANADAPPFEEVAKRSGFSESGMVRFLLDPHAKMPNMNLSRTEAADIAAYISRLR
jgi:mono/diheme cytochrome c family protein